MAIRILLFLGFLISVMIYPFFINDYKKKIVVVNSVLPNVSFVNGNFKIYNGIIEKKGSFSKLDVFNYGYVADNLFAQDMIKKEIYQVKKAVFKNRVIKGYDLSYKNKDLELHTKSAVYDKETKILDGGEFVLNTENIRGYGKAFEIDNNKNLYAQKITYYIKVDK